LTDQTVWQTLPFVVVSTVHICCCIDFYSTSWKI